MKILILLGILVLALTLGTAYAGSRDMSAGEYNGITAFEEVPSASHDFAPGLALANGITAFDLRIEVLAPGAESSAAGGLSTMEPSKELSNGVTIFDTSTVPEPN